MPSLPSGGQVYVENSPRRDSMRFKLIIATVKTDVTDSIVDAAKTAAPPAPRLPPRTVRAFTRPRPFLV